MWPQWMARLAQDLGSGHTESVLEIGHDETGAWSTTAESVRSKQGSQLTAKVREVCRTCNTGWMSQLEQDVKPHVLRMMSVPLARLVMDPSQCALVASWALKGAWMRELTSPGSRTASAQMRAHLSSFRTPPPGTRVWAAQHRGDLHWDTRMASAVLLHRDRPLDLSGARRVLLCTVTFAGITLMTRTVSGQGVPEQHLDPDLWLPLWPVSTPVTWPPRRPAADADVMAAARKLPGRIVGPWKGQ